MPCEKCILQKREKKAEKILFRADACVCKKNIVTLRDFSAGQKKAIRRIFII
jgi:hypothetical protein